MQLLSNDDVLNPDEHHDVVITTTSGHSSSPPSASWDITQQAAATTILSSNDSWPTELWWLLLSSSSSWWCHHTKLAMTSKAAAVRRTAEEEAVAPIELAPSVPPPLTTWIPPQQQPESVEECHGGRSDSRIVECTSFPVRLHRLLQDNDVSTIVSWDPHGRSFHIRDVKKFIFEILPRYFHQTKLTSFRRQLYVYGYRQITSFNSSHSQNHRGSYYHAFFVRDRPDLCRFVVMHSHPKGKHHLGNGGKGGNSGMTSQSSHGVYRNHHDSGTVPLRPLSMKPKLPTVIMTKKSLMSSSSSCRFLCHHHKT